MESVILSPAQVERYSRPGPRYTSYPTVPVWTADFGENDYYAALADVAARPEDTLSVYLHLPFCAERCAYCGCNATSTKRPAVVDAYLDRVERELEMVVPRLGERRRVAQMHWGGGTPNFLNEAQTRRIYGLMAAAFNIESTAEVSVELDPRIGSPEQMAFYREIGFNRVSFGVQDINERVQQAIGRIQPFEQTEKLYLSARELGYASVNIDLVYGLPYQTDEGFAKTIDAIVELRPDRVACFGYAHLPNSRLNQKQVDAGELPDAIDRVRLFQLALSRFCDDGYDWIGLDHFALAEDEMAVALRERRLHRNFMGYTTKPAPHMLAFGMSSIGDLAGRFVQNDMHLGHYQKAIDSGHLPVVKGMHLTRDDEIRRMAITHLMCNLELPYDLTLNAFGVRLDDYLGEDLDRVAAYADDGFVELLPDRLQVTGLGRYFIRNLAMEIDAHLKRGGGERPLFSKTL